MNIVQIIRNRSLLLGSCARGALRLLGGTALLAGLCILLAEPEALTRLLSFSAQSIHAAFAKASPTGA